MIEKTRIYPAKILLFGEYTVIHGSDSLAIPFDGYFAQWKYSKKEQESRKSLADYAVFLRDQCSDFIDVTSLELELQAGLYLESSIPRGYGAGSSGSVVAAIFDCFSTVDIVELGPLRAHFQQMESYFHGSSSGIDPLVSYLKQAIYLRDGGFEVVDISKSFRILDRLFLFDSGMSRSTAPLVDWYKKKLEEDDFRQVIYAELIPLNGRVMRALLENDLSSFERCIQEISSIQWQYFTKMMDVESVRKLLVLDLSFKLCGAGGGGFYLIYSMNGPGSSDWIPLVPN